MKFWGLLAMIGGSAAVDTYAAVQAGACQNKVGCAGYYRALGVSTTPPNSDFGPPSNVTGISVAAIGFQAAGTQAGGEAKLDVGGFRFKTPADATDANNKGLSFYWGYLGVGGTWNSGQATGNIAGALAEVVASISSVNVYYDNDGQAGFQWAISQPDPTKRWDIYDCTNAATNKYDCVDKNAVLNVANDLQWTPIDHQKLSCSAAPGLTSGTYTTGCEIHTLTTIGSLPTAPGVPVLSFTIRIASQPVLINGVKHGPDYAKWDLQINFPWSNYPNILDSANARLALVTVAAGKAGAFVGSAQRSNGADSMSWQAQGMAVRGYYEYNASATSSGAATNVYTQIITGQQILDFQCTNASPCFGILGVSATNALVTLALKPGILGAAVWGWKASIAVHAFGDVKMPASVEWDPVVGAGEANSAMLAVPSVLLLAVVAMFSL